MPMRAPPRYRNPEELTALLLWWWSVCEEAVAAPLVLASDAAAPLVPASDAAAPLVPASVARRGAVDIVLMVAALLSSACGMVREILLAAAGKCAVDPLVPVPLRNTSRAQTRQGVDGLYRRRRVSIAGKSRYIYFPTSPASPTHAQHRTGAAASTTNPSGR
jgi:hypothetical protein